MYLIVHQMIEGGEEEWGKGKTRFPLPIPLTTSVWEEFLARN